MFTLNIKTDDILIGNASLLLKNLNSNYDVDKNGQLHVIAKWNLVGRLVKCIKNYNGNVTRKVEAVVLETLKAIMEFEKTYNDKLLIPHLEKTYDDLPIRKWGEHLIKNLLQPVLPSTRLASKIGKKFLKNNQFQKNQDIKEAANILRSEYFDWLDKNKQGF